MANGEKSISGRFKHKFGILALRIRTPVVEITTKNCARAADIKFKMSIAVRYKESGNKACILVLQ